MTDAPASDEFRINERCIDCGTCWTFDPDHFAAGAGTAVVAHQPRGASSQRQALLASQACPVAAIETSRALQRTTPADGFPSWICSHAAGEVFYCGWASQRSFGARSWLIQRADGNVMVDVPWWSAPLARRIQAMGGLSQIVLTHRDDVAEHQRWAQAFACERSLQRLQPQDVAWLLPGHGHRQHFQPGAWTEAVKQTLTWIQAQH